MRGLKNKVVVIAGGGSGIGRATALRLAEEGAAVVIGDVPGNAARELAAQITGGGGRAISVEFDMSDEASVQNLMAAAVKNYGGIDGLHANAADMGAIMQDTDAVSIDLAIFDRTLTVNLRGHLLCTRYALPEMLKRGGGSIVYSSSAAAFIGEANRVAYGISKSGLNALMRHVASRWGKEGIRANAIAPGLVPTEKTRDHLPKEFIDYALSVGHSPRLGVPDDIAALVVMLLSDDSAWINGQAISIDGGTTMR